MDTDGREVVYASTLERDVAAILATHPQVRSFEEQPPAVSYVDRGGKHRWHTFDFRVRLHSGIRLAIAVKPAFRVEPSGLSDMISILRRNPPSNFSDRFEIRTEKEICRVQASNARLILRARQARDEEATEVAIAFVSTMRGQMTIGRICDALTKVELPFLTVVALIDDGHLRAVSFGKISASTLVEQARRS